MAKANKLDEIKAQMQALRVQAQEVVRRRNVMLTALHEEHRDDNEIKAVDARIVGLDNDMKATRKALDEARRERISILSRYLPNDLKF